MSWHRGQQKIQVSKLELNSVTAAGRVLFMEKLGHKNFDVDYTSYGNAHHRLRLTCKECYGYVLLNKQIQNHRDWNVTILKTMDNYRHYQLYIGIIDKHGEELIEVANIPAQYYCRKFTNLW